MVQVSDCAANGETKAPRREMDSRKENKRYDMAGNQVRESGAEAAGERSGGLWSRGFPDLEPAVVQHGSLVSRADALPVGLAKVSWGSGAGIVKKPVLRRLRRCLLPKTGKAPIRRARPLNKGLER